MIHGDERALLSVLERGFIALLQRHNLPLPETNIPKDGHWVDCRWHEPPVTVELDSYQWDDVFLDTEPTLADLGPLLSATSAAVAP